MTALDYGNFDDPENLPIASSSNRSHAFVPEAIFKSQACAKCGGRIKPNTMAIKCISCNAVVHGTCGVSYQAPCKPAAKKPDSNRGRSISESSDEEYAFDPIRRTRKHDFVLKRRLGLKNCPQCGKSITPGTAAFICSVCDVRVHTECRDLFKMPCITATSIPTYRGEMGTLASYTPESSPVKIPSLIIHCVAEIELRGMKENGLYIETGDIDKAMKLVEEFIKFKEAPDLRKIDVYTIAATLQIFLISLKESLIPDEYWNDFIHATRRSDETARSLLLRQAILELPQANRETLTFLIIHLKRVYEKRDSPEAIEDIAHILQPMLWKESNSDNILHLFERRFQISVAENLLKISLIDVLQIVDYESLISTEYTMNRHPTMDRLRSPDLLSRRMGLRRPSTYVPARKMNSSESTSYRRLSAKRNAIHVNQQDELPKELDPSGSYPYTRSDAKTRATQIGHRNEIPEEMDTSRNVPGTSSRARRNSTRMSF